MRLAIADPPYPPQLTERHDLADGTARITSRSRATRYYSDQGVRPRYERQADHHPAAAEWDDPARHRALLEQLLDEFDGWAIATSPDGLGCYHPLPIPARVMAWVRPTAPPGTHHLLSRWEPVIVYVPVARRGRAGRLQVPDVLVATVDRVGFTGAKPARWTRWVLDAMGYTPDDDVVTDLFPGSGSVGRVLNVPTLL